MKRLTEPTPDIPEPRHPVGSIFSRLVDSLIAEWERRDKAGDTSEWCLRLTIPPIVDSKCSRLRTILGDKLCARGDIPPLSIQRQWVTPCEKHDKKHWIHRKQEVKIWLVPRVDDARTENLMEWMRRQEHSQAQKRKYDAWQRRTRRGSIMSVADPIPPIPYLAKLYADFRFEEGEPMHHFRVKYDISDSMDLYGWAKTTKYPLGSDVTPEQHAAWITEWFGPEGLPEPERPETFQEQQMRWKRQGGRSPDEQFAWERGLPMPVTLVYPGRAVVKGDKKCPTK